MRRAYAGGAGGGDGAGGAADERGGAAAGASGEVDAARGREQVGLLRCEPPARPAQALSGAGEARWRAGAPGLGSFATAEEAALCVARTPEGRVAAGLAAAAEGQGTLPAAPSGASLKQEGTVPPMPPGAFVKGEGVVPPMPPDAFVKVEVVVKEEEGSDSRPKRQRTK